MIGRLYRSPRIVSASIGGWRYADGAAHGESWGGSFVVDADSGRPVELETLVALDRVARICWDEFSQRTSPMDDQGRFIAANYPFERFERLVRTAGWWVSAAGLTLEFGLLFGYVGGPFACHLPVEELRPIAKPGVTVPF